MIITIKYPCKYRLKFAVLDQGIFCGNSANYILFDGNKQNIYSIACYLNSEIPNWFFKCYSTNSNVNGYEVDNLPIPNTLPKKLEIIYRYLNLMMGVTKKEYMYIGAIKSAITSNKNKQ